MVKTHDSPSDLVVAWSDFHVSQYPSLITPGTLKILRLLLLAPSVLLLLFSLWIFPLSN